MKTPGWFTNAVRWGVAIAMSGLALSDAAAQSAPATAGSKVVEIGAADADAVGKLPALTHELSQRAAAAVSKRDWTAARAAYRDMVDADPENPLALANLGSVEYQLRDFDPAVEHLEHALKQRPNLAQTWLTLGMVYYEREEHLRALSAISRAVAEKPDDPRGHNYLAATAKALGWLGAAESELQHALDLDPDYAEANFNLALIYLERRPPAIELARRHYLKAIERGSPKDPLVEKQLNEGSGEETNPDAPAPAEPSKPASANTPEPGTKPAGTKTAPAKEKPASTKKRSAKG